MKVQLLRNMLIVCAISLVTSLSTSCLTNSAAEPPPAITISSTPEKLDLIEGELDPCLLIKPKEVEALLGVEVVNKAFYLDYRPSCEYVSPTNNQAVVLMISATTDVSIEKANQPWLKVGDQPISAEEAYQRDKLAGSRLSEVNQFEVLEDIGDQAFLYKTNFLVINVLRNSVFYSFYGQMDYGFDEAMLMEFVRIGLERVP